MSGPHAGAEDLASALRAHANCTGNLDVSPGIAPGVAVLKCPGCGGASEHLLGDATGIAEREAAAAASLEVAVPSRGLGGAEYGTTHSSSVGRRRRILRTAVAIVAIVGVAATTTYFLDPGGGVDVTESAAPAGTEAAAEPELVTVDGAFSVALPDGWKRESADGATVITPATGGAAVAVYYQRGNAEREEVAEQASAVLAERHPGASVSKPEAAGRDGDLEIRSSYPGGRERALISVDDGLALVVITELPAGADPASVEAAEAAASSVVPAN